MRVDIYVAFALVCKEEIVIVREREREANENRKKREKCLGKKLLFCSAVQYNIFNASALLYKRKETSKKISWPQFFFLLYLGLVSF